MAIITFWKSNNKVSISIELVIDDLTIFIFKEHFFLSFTFFRPVIHKDSFLFENSTNGGLGSGSVIVLSIHPLNILRLISYSNRSSNTFWCVIWNCDHFILTGGHKISIFVPIPTGHLFGVFAHCWDLLFVLFQIEVDVSFFISKS